MENDVRSTTGDDLRDAEVVCGGFPCQDVSVAGHRAGLVGDKSGLWFEFHRLIGEARPPWVVIENVPGLLSSNGGRDMGTVLGGLGDLGYGWAYRVLDAQWFGVPQRRRRVFIVGCLRDRRRPAQVLFNSASVRGDFGSGAASRQESAGDSEDGVDERGVPRVSKPLIGITGKAGSRPDLDGGAYIPYRKATRAHAHDDWERWEVAEQANALDTGNSTVTSHAVAYSVTPESGQGSRLHVREIEQANALTFREADKGDRGTRVVAGKDEEWLVRRLTPTECERLQGFPDGWTAGQADSHRYRQLGNAVCVNVAEWLGKRLYRWI